MSLLKSLFGRPAPRRVTLAPDGPAFDVAPGETVLESALKQGLTYPHDCTVGTCGSCRSKLLAGRVEAITPFGYTLSRDELEAGYILACQALPKSDLTLEVEISTGGEAAPVVQAAVLSAVEDLTHDIKRLTWTLETPLRWRAGQYVNVRWDGGTAHRSYSLATAPDRAGLTQVSTFVRHVPGGAFTDRVFGGDPRALRFELDGPHGNFWLRDGAGPFLCIAGGSGLAPILSLLQDAANRRVRRDCILLFGARARRDLYAEPEIAAIRRAWTAGFDFWPVLSEEPVEGVRSGMVTAHVAAALAKLGPGVHGYMCGPPPMIDAGIHALTACGLALADIHYDKFTDASSRGERPPARSE
jgi:p-cymene monooxygenase electron transfer component